MKKITNHFDEIEKRCRRKKKFLFLFDFDGVVSTIEDHPMAAKLKVGWKPILRKLAKHKAIDVGIVTGREYKDVRKRIGSVPGIYISSNHGYEVWKGGKKVFSIGCEFKTPMHRMGREIWGELGKTNGVVIEIKDYSVAIHYRLAKGTQQRRIENAFQSIVKKYEFPRSLEILKGKKLMEARPRGFWDKGKSVNWISSNISPGSLIFYFGDDRTDEDAFKVMKNKGISVYVGGDKPSAAKYWVGDMDEMLPLIEWILNNFQ